MTATKSFVSVTVDTSLCSFAVAAGHAIALAATHELVSFVHGSTEIEVSPGWTASDLEFEWRRAAAAAARTEP